MSNARKLADLLDSAGDIKAAHLDNVVDALPLAGGTMTGNIAHASDFTLDVGGDIILDAGGQNWYFDDDGTRVFSIAQVSSDVYIGTEVADKDLIFRVNDSDGGGVITALTLDASAAGKALFNSGADFAGTVTADGLSINSGTTDTIGTFTSTDTGAAIRLIDATGNSTIETNGATLRISADDDDTVADSIIKFRIDGATKAEIDDDGKVYINKTARTGNGNVGLLQVASSDASLWSSINTGSYPYSSMISEISVMNTQDDATNSYAGIFFQAGETSAGSAINAARIGAIRESAFNTSLVFANRSSTSGMAERVRILSSGNVGIGTSSPTGKLEIQQAQITTQFDRDSFLRLHPSAHTNSTGFTNMMFGTSTTNNYGVAIGGLRAGTDDAPSFSIRMLNDSISGTEVMRIDSSGNVGIGVTPESDWRSNITGLQIGNSGSIFARNDSGETKTFISENVKWTSDAQEYINNGYASVHKMDAGTHTFQVAASGTADAAISWTDAMTIENDGQLLVTPLGVSTPSFSFIGDDNTGITRPTSDTLQFVTGGSEKMRINSDGKVGIGTSTPQNSHTKANLLVVGSGSAGGIGLWTGTGDGGYYFARSNANDTDSYDGGMSYDGSRNLRFHTNAGSTRMTINGSGKVGIGIDSPNYKFDVNGKGKFGDESTVPDKVLNAISDGGSNQMLGLYDTRADSSSRYCAVFHRVGTNGSMTWVGSISEASGSVSFNTTSDYRLKQNVDYTWDATTRLKLLKPCRFTWKNDDTDTLQDGFLAHEVSDHVPQAVMEEKDADVMQSIDHSKLVPLLAKTIQELEARITTLENA